MTITREILRAQRDWTKWESELVRCAVQHKETDNNRLKIALEAYMDHCDKEMRKATAAEMSLMRRATLREEVFALSRAMA